MKQSYWTSVLMALAGFAYVKYGVNVNEDMNTAVSQIFGFLPIFFLWSTEHGTITRAAIRVLPPREQEWLEPERELLENVYCDFPDLNSPWGGEWGGEPGNPNEPRVPDLRREWNISYYCGWDPVYDTSILHPPGKDILPPASPRPSLYPIHNQEEARFCHSATYWYPKWFLERILLAVEEGRFGCAMRFLGALLHHIEDKGAFSYWPELHCKGHVSDQNIIQITGYTPQTLGETPEETVTNIVRRMRDLARYQADHVDDARRAHESKNQEEIDRVVCGFAQETCRVVADVIHTVIHLLDYAKVSNYWGYWLEFPKTGNPTGLNLVDNPSFERDDGSLYPDGWVIGWQNLNDRIGQAVWDWSRKHSIFSKIVRSGERSVKLMWTPQEGLEWRQRWPVAIPTVAGELYRTSGWIKTQDATGETYLALYLHKRNNALIEMRKGPILRDTNDWQRVTFDTTIPTGVEKIRLSCRSDANEGAAWFDDVEIVRI